MKLLMRSIIAFYVGFVAAQVSKSLDMPTFTGYALAVILFIVFLKVDEAFNKRNEQNNTL